MPHTCPLDQSRPSGLTKPETRTAAFSFPQHLWRGAPRDSSFVRKDGAIRATATCRLHKGRFHKAPFHNDCRFPNQSATQLPHTPPSIRAQSTTMAVAVPIQKDNTQDQED